MNTLLLICTLLTVVIVTENVEGRIDSCYTCSPTSSWDECEANQVKSECDCSHLAANCDRCIKYEGNKKGVRTYGKMCGTKVFCDSDYVGCQHLVESKNCEIHCCDEDDCNSATNVMISAGVLVIFSFIAMIKNLY